MKTIIAAFLLSTALLPLPAQAGMFDGVVPLPVKLESLDRKARPIFAEIQKGVALDPALDDLAASVKDAPDLEKVAVINAFVNEMIDYRVDRKDFWALPRNTAAAAMGDCEDYAFLKMAALIKAGLPMGAMAVQIVLTADGQHHAVLSIAFTEKTLILDNLTQSLRTAEEIEDYKPLFALIPDGTIIHTTKIAKN